MIKRFYRCAVGALLIFAMTALAGVGYFGRIMPDEYRFVEGQAYSFEGNRLLGIARPGDVSKPVAAQGDDFFADITFMGIPIKTVHISQSSQNVVLLSGKPFGVKLFTQGVLIVGVSPVSSSGGQSISPCENAGLSVGDIILSIDGTQLHSNEDLKKFAAAGKSLQVNFLRDGVSKNTTLTPVKDTTGIYKLGIWVRDSSAGIGTMTFIKQDSKSFAGLGHGISDVDTKQVLPLGSGQIVSATITGIKKGATGTPGELKGTFNSNVQLGSLSENSEYGLFGSYTGSITPQMQSIEVANLNQVHQGQAQILSTIDGDTPKYYDVEITSVNYNKNQKSKNLVIKVTDPQLIEKCGGIVQGMSGSPIVQDGLLVGAVTHVLVNDPTRGYGILAQNMLSRLS